MPRGLIQYATDAKIRRQERFRAAQHAAFDKYVESYARSAARQVKTCSKCHVTAIHPIKIHKYTDCVVITWKCENCGREAVTQISTNELIGCYNEDKRQQAVIA